MDPKEYISGKMFFRYMGTAEHIVKDDPRELWACAAVLGIPESVGLKKEHLYHLTSGKNPMGDLHGMIYPEMGIPKDIQQLHLHLVTGMDYTKEMHGCGLGHVVTKPCWQI